MKVGYDTINNNLLESSLEVANLRIIKWLHTLYICRDGCNLRTLTVGIKAVQ